MSAELTYDPNSSPVNGAITVPIHTVDVPSHAANTLSNPDLTAVQGLAVQYWKVANGVVVAMSGTEQASVDTAAATAVTAAQRSAAQADLTSASDLGKLERAVADIIVNQLNLHTTWEAALTSAIAAASSLADLKTRVAAITTVSAVTLAQAKTAILSDIAAGTEGD